MKITMLAILAIFCFVAWIACVQPAPRAYSLTAEQLTSENQNRIKIGLSPLDDSWTPSGSSSDGGVVLLTYERHTVYGVEVMQMERRLGTYALTKETFQIPSGRNYVDESGTDSECLTISIDRPSGEMAVTYWGDREKIRESAERVENGRSTLKSCISELRSKAAV